MKNNLLLINTVFLLFILSIRLFSQENANEGKKFLIAFPQNEIANTNDFVQNVKLGIYISSKSGAKVTLINHQNSIIINKTVPANGMLQLDNNEMGNRNDVEDISDGTLSNKVIEITSDKLISVYVINSKSFTSDGYLAYPITEWGKNYIHNSFYHHNTKNGFRVENRSSGCTIISQDDNTQIKIILKGRGGNLGSTKTGNYRIGDTILVNVKANQSYTFKTKSDYDNTFDFSGSLITSNKPIGVISFHERTFIPQENPSKGRDHLIEMMQPLSNWRNRYVSIDFGREFGDFFRVLPLKDNTHLTIKNYDKQGNLLFDSSLTIQTGGGFYEYNNIKINGYNSQKYEGIKGNTIWESDSPIMVTQYSYSENWDKTTDLDNGDNYDPFMLNLINEEQFTTNISFLAPPYSDFEKHSLNIVIKVDTLQSINKQLESLIFDGDPIYLSNPLLLNNRIGNTEFYWFRKNINSGIHFLTSDVRFAAFLYGFGDADSYGMQTALGNVGIIDTLVMSNFNYDCSSFNLTYHIQSKFGLDSDDGFEPTNIKISKVEIKYKDNVNLNYTFSNDSLAINLSGTFDNQYLPGVIYLKIISETGKVFYDSLRYQLNNSIALSENKVYNSKPDEVNEYDIYLNEKNDSLSFLKDFNLTIRYKRDWFKIEDVILNGKSYIDNLSYQHQLDTTYAILDIVLNRSVITNGNRIKILLKNLLGKDTLYTPEFSLYSKFENNCYKGSKIDTLRTKVCAQDLRIVLFEEENSVQLSNNTLIATKDVDISLIDYTGRYLIEHLKLENGRNINLNSYQLPKGLYFIIDHNFPNRPPLKYFHF